MYDQRQKFKANLILINGNGKKFFILNIRVFCSNTNMILKNLQIFHLRDLAKGNILLLVSNRPLR